MTSSIATKLLQFNENLNPAERANLKLLLGLAAGGLASSGVDHERCTSSEAFRAVSSTLSLLQPYSGRLTYNGVAYRGRPEFMSDKLLRDLQSEALRVRPTASRFDEHFLGRGAPTANQLAVSNELRDFVTTHAGRVEATGIASYLFYDEIGQGIDPHIDTDIFALNVLIMLSHKRPHDAKGASSLVIFPPGLPAERLLLVDGEMVILFAGSITHGRERMAANESVSILTLGFQPIGT